MVFALLVLLCYLVGCTDAAALVAPAQSVAVWHTEEAPELQGGDEANQFLELEQSLAGIAVFSGTTESGCSD